jgi:hypothetical protein
MPEDQNLFDLPLAPEKPIRAWRRSEEWRADRRRMRDYLLSRATPEQQEAIRLAYERELALGPDFLRIWSGSKRPDPHEEPPPPPDPDLSPARWREAIRQFMRQTLAAARAEGEKRTHPVKPSSAGVADFLTEAADDHCRVGGLSYAALAAGAGCCERTAISMVAELEAYGWLARQPMKRATGSLFPREVQAPNLYTLTWPAAFRIVKGVLNAGPVRKTLKFAGELLGGVSRWLTEEGRAAELQGSSLAASGAKAKGLSPVSQESGLKPAQSLADILKAFVTVPSDCKICEAKPNSTNKLPISSPTKTETPLAATLANLQRLIESRNKPG